MVRLVERRVPEGDDRIPLIFVDGPALLMNDIGHGREVVIEKRGERLRVQALGDAGESLQIGEKDGEHPSLTPQFQAVGIPDEFFDDRRAQVLLEGVLDKHLLTALRGIINQAGAEKRNGYTRFLNDQRQPESLTIGDQTKGQPAPR